MKTLTCLEPGRLILEDKPLPAIQDGHALIRIDQVGVCGTDLHAWEGTQPYFSYPRILGHELAATVESAPAGSGFAPGMAVTLIPYFHCGHCVACRKGQTNCCVHMSVCGVHEDGGMREYLSVPVAARLDGGGLTRDELALTEPLAIGAHGVRRAAIHAGEHVLIIGAGPIGLATMMFALAAGAHVIAVDTNRQRLQFCSNQLGIADCLVAGETGFDDRLKAVTGGSNADVVIDCTGNLRAINDSFRWMAHAGRYVLIGLQREMISFSHPEFHKREGTLMSSRNATREDFDTVIRAIRSRAINPTALITHRVMLAETPDNFSTWMNPASGTIKAMIHIA